MEYEIYKGPDELYHWGIKGMRWGQRRYQNKDGSLTAAGRKRYNAEMAKLKAEEEVLKKRKATAAKLTRLENKRKSIEEQKKALDGKNDDEAAPVAKAKGSGKKSVGVKEIEKQASKSLRDMTDDELINAINRARLEDTYRQLRPEAEKHPLMKKVVNDVVIPTAIDSGKKLLGNVMNNLIEKATGGKVDENSIEALTKTRDKLKLVAEINKYKKNPDGEINWENATKQHNLAEAKADIEAQKRGYESAKEERKATGLKARQEAETAAAAKKAAEEAKAAEQKARKEAKEAEKKAEKDAKLAEQKAAAAERQAEAAEREAAALERQRKASTPVSKETVSSGKSFVDSFGDTLFTVNSSNTNAGRSFVGANGDTLFTWGDD